MKYPSITQNRTGVVPLQNTFDPLVTAYISSIDWDKRLEREIPFLTEQFSGSDHCLLDVACGPGFHAIALSRVFSQVIGLDLSVEMIRNAQEHAHPSSLEQSPHWIIGSMTHLPLRQKRCSGIISDGQQVKK